MIQSNYFLALSYGKQAPEMGRTDADPSVMDNVLLPNGCRGKIIVVPHYFVQSFRTKFFYNNQKLNANTSAREWDVWLNMQAMLAWIDERKLKHLR